MSFIVLATQALAAIADQSFTAYRHGMREEPRWGWRSHTDYVDSRGHVHNDDEDERYVFMSATTNCICDGTSSITTDSEDME
jgi:predicted metal-dependent HD superfamily phosphohydrolase